MRERWNKFHVITDLELQWAPNLGELIHDAKERLENDLLERAAQGFGSMRAFIHDPVMSFNRNEACWCWVLVLRAWILDHSEHQRLINTPPLWVTENLGFAAYPWKLVGEFLDSGNDVYYWCDNCLCREMYQIAAYGHGPLPTLAVPLRRWRNNLVHQTCWVGECGHCHTGYWALARPQPVSEVIESWARMPDEPREELQPAELRALLGDAGEDGGVRFTSEGGFILRPSQN